MTYTDKRINWARSIKNASGAQNNISHTSLKRSRYNIVVKLSDGGALIFNSSTRTLARLSADELGQYDSFVSEKPTPLSASLAADGFLVGSARNELTETKVKYLQAKRDSSLLLLTIAPTMACNLACGYCFQGLNKDLDKASRDHPDEIIEFIKSKLEGVNKISVTWYGGEPLMAKENIYSTSDKIISLCDRYGIAYSSSIVTNGYFLDVKVAQQLWSRRVTSAQVTIDGLEKTHDKMRPLISGRGSYKKIIENIGNVLEQTPLTVAMRVNVGRENVDECNELLDEMKRHGFDKRPNFQLYFSPIDAATEDSGTAFDVSLSKEEFNKAVVKLTMRGIEMGLIPQIEAPGGFLGMCVAAHDNGFVITHRGDIHKCWETAHDPRKRVGEIAKPEKIPDNLNKKIWDSWTPFDSDVCKACKILPMCGGHCGHRFIYSGAGNDFALPCPEWKWNTAEYIFARAKALGAVRDEDWMDGASTSIALQSGERHSPESLLAAQSKVIDRVNEVSFTSIDRDYILSGDGRDFE